MRAQFYGNFKQCMQLLNQAASASALIKPQTRIPPPPSANSNHSTTQSAALIMCVCVSVQLYVIRHYKASKCTP